MPFKNRTNLKYINMKNIFMLTNKSERKIGGKRFSVILLLLCLSLFTVYGQGKKNIKGLVTDEKNEPLIGVSVVEVGTSNGTITDVDGKFEINVSSNSTLKFSYIGYNVLEKKIGTQTVMNVVLTEAASELDEVVVVGYGTVKKRDLTGSVTSVDSEKLLQSPALSAAEAIQGKVPGVLIQNTSWTPGATPSILIRGTRSIKAGNDPLYVVDGIPISTAPNLFAPGDIESIEVLKDASATAIYGSRGANGVIIISTKKGKKGKVQVDYNGYYGIQTIQNKLELMDGAEYAEYVREAYRAAGQYDSALETMNKEAVEYIRGIPVVKVFQQTIYSFKNFHAAIEEYEKFASGYALKCRIPLTGFTVTLNGTFVLLIPVAMFILSGVSGQAAYENVVMDFLFYSLFTPVCATMMNRIMFASEQLMAAKSAVSRVDEILQEKPLKEPEHPLIPADASIVFSDVSFAYPGAKEKALDHISFEVPTGKTVALVGASGSGKSTAASLIPRFYDVQSGSVTIGGVDVRNIEKQELMKRVAFVFQNTCLFKDTLLNNIKAARPDATREEVLKAADEAQCKDIIDRLPDGLDTLVGTGGTYLSGGENQRIALARAILKDAPIIVLDEATAFADAENEHQIQLAFERLTQNKTEQIALCQYIRDGHINSQTRKIRRLYSNKTKDFYSILKKEFPNAQISISENTLQIIMSVKFDKDIEVFEKSSISLFVEKYENGLITIVLSPSGIPSSKLLEGAKTLRKAIE